jgi:hypothetical protein
MLKQFYTTLSLSGISFLLSFSLLAQNPGSPNLRQCQDDGIISIAFSGATEITTCSDDEVTDRIRFQVRPFFQAFAYLVVDEGDIIQYIGFSNFINFDLLPGGMLRVYAFSNYGRITAEVGDTFTGANLSRPCFGITTNFVTVNNGTAEGIRINSDVDRYSVCPGDGEDDIVTVSSPALNVTYLITRPDGFLLDTNTSGSINFEASDIGICYIYAFAGTLPAEFTNVSELTGITGCGIGLSDNFITVDRASVMGGTITTAAGENTVSLCPGDGVPDVINFLVEGSSPSTNRLLVTDTNNVIIDLPEGSSFDFDGAGVGISRVWSFTFTGVFTGMTGDTVGVSRIATGCTDLSESFVEIVREVPLGGTVATADGTTEVTTCPGDGTADIISFATTGSAGGELIYVITDANNLILNFNTVPEFDVEGAGVGNCRIWSVTYQGNATVVPTQDITVAVLADGCFALSDNFINVIRTVPAGGTVATDAGETAITLCPGDGLDDLVTFVSTGAADGLFTFVVTDENNNILEVPTGNTVNFDGADLGVCRLWGLSYAGELLAMAGDDAASTVLASGCFNLSDNFVTVTREQLIGGTVSLTGGVTEIAVCPGDGVQDLLTFFSNGGEGDNFSFLVTDDQGNFLARPDADVIDFEDIAAGVCRVYGIFYLGELTIEDMQDVNAGNLATGCFALSDNFVTVTRQAATTGPISTEDGETEILACPGDNIPDVFRFDSTGTTLSRFNYLLTDENNVVISVPFTDRINFEQLPEGVCRVYGLGYDGIIVARPGDIAGVDPLASQCHALSENFVTVTKQLPVGGTVALVDGGGTEITVCPQDGVPDFVEVATDGASGQSFTYLVTDSDNVILFVSTLSTLDFDNAPFGVCRIWGLSYQGELLASVDDDAGVAQLATGCFSLSDNFVTVIREDLVGGTISTDASQTVVFTCPDDGLADIVTFANDGASGSNYQYLVTDEDNTVLALVDGDSYDFEPAGPGVCRVWGFAYAGNVTIVLGDDAATTDLADGCFALSDNFITIIRETPLGGSVSLADGSLEVAVCSGVEGEPALEFLTTSTSSNYTYLIVQADSFVLTAVDGGFDFSNATGGVFQVYGLAYAGNLSFFPGQNIFTTDLASSCFELSDTFITVNVTRVDGGTIMGNGAEEVYFCDTNDDDGFVRFTTTSALSENNYRYVITTNTPVPVIISMVEMGSDSFDFATLPLMDVRVYAISYDGNLLAGPGTPVEISPLATGCAELSENFILVLNDSPEAEEISFDNVPGTGISCSADGEGSISVSTTSTSLTGYAIIVTDSMNIIQLISLDPTDVDLGSLPPGGYRVWGLAYTGSVVAQVGDDLMTAFLADNCYETTTDFLNVTQGGDITAGMILNLTTEGTGDTISWCIPLGDNPIAVVDATVTGPNYRYIVTGENGVIRVANLTSNIIPFQRFGPGTYRIYGFNYTGQSLVGINQNINTSLLSTECAALTSNFITVIYSDPDGGMVTTLAGETEVELEIEAGPDGPTAVLEVTTTADGPEDYTYVVTDEDNIILTLSANATIDFGPDGVGVCRVWGLAYTGNITAGMGDAATAVLSDGCFALSDNFVTVTRVDEEGFNDDTEDVFEVGGMDELEMLARPNPATGSILYIDLASLGGVPNGQIFVRDMNGVAYSVQRLIGGDNSTTVPLDISMLPSGMYFAQLAFENGIKSVRFMKN